MVPNVGVGPHEGSPDPSEGSQEESYQDRREHLLLLIVSSRSSSSSAQPRRSSENNQTKHSGQESHVREKR